MDFITDPTFLTALAAVVSAVAVGLKYRADTRLAVKQSDLETLRTIIDELREQNVALTLRVTHLENENASLENKIDKLIKKNKELESARDTLRERMVELSEENERLHRHIGELRERLEAYRKQSNGNV